MFRPLMQKSISDLEKMFSVSSTDLEVLGRLESELKLRQTQRAATLFQKVQKAVAACSIKPSERATIHLPKANEANAQKATPLKTASAAVKWPEAQPELWPVDEQALLVKSAGQQLVSVTAPKAAVPHVGPSERSSLPKIDEAEAYKLLGAEPTTRWEMIEDRRRRLVQQAHPDKLLRLDAVKRTEALAAARKINVAYAVLLQLRIATKP